MNPGKVTRLAMARDGLEPRVIPEPTVAGHEAGAGHRLEFRGHPVFLPTAFWKLIGVLLIM